MNTFVTIFILMLTDPMQDAHVGMPIGGFADSAACTRAASQMTAKIKKEHRPGYWQCEETEVVLKAPAGGTQAPRWAVAGYHEVQ